MDAPPAAPSDPTPANPFRTPANRFRTTNPGFRMLANRFRMPANRFRTPANRFGMLANRFGTTNLPSRRPPTASGPQTLGPDHKPSFRTTNLRLAGPRPRPILIAKWSAKIDQRV